MSRKEEKIDNGVYFLWSRKHIFFICHDLSVYWLKHRYTQAVNRFSPIVVYHPHSTFRSRKHIFFICHDLSVYWMKHRQRRRCRAIPFFFHPPPHALVFGSPRGWASRFWDETHIPSQLQVRPVYVPPLFILWRKQKKTRKWIFYQLTQLCSERKSWSHSRLRLWHYNPARPSPPKEGNSAYGEIYLRKLSPLFRGPNTPRQPMNYSLNATFSKHRAGERSMVVNHGGWA